MKVGRNDPCPCGSGRKYKQCCMARNVTPAEDLDYRRLSDVYNKLLDRLVQHARQVFGDMAVPAALRELLLWPDAEEARSDAERVKRFMPLFWPWFVYNWEIDPEEPEPEVSGPAGVTVAELYARKLGSKLDAHERRFIEAVNRKPFSFYEVVEVEPGREILLQDVLTGRRVLVQERTGSQYVRKSDIVFARLAVIGSVGMFAGLSTYPVPPLYKPDIIGLRAEIKAEDPTITEEVLVDWELDIRGLLLELDRRLFTTPKLVNTDGDPIEYHTVFYEIDSAEEAFEKLASLCVTTTVGRLRKEAERDADGRIIRAEINWDRRNRKAGSAFPNTVLGNIIIDGNRLTANLNSARRAKTLREKIEARLGTGARFKLEEIGNVEKMLAEDMSKGRSAERSAGNEALMRDPKVRRRMADMIRKHWESWVDAKVPALGGKTPREAVRTPDGVEAVEALLVHAERSQAAKSQTREMYLEGIRLAREALGIPKPPQAGE